VTDANKTGHRFHSLLSVGGNRWALASPLGGHALALPERTGTRSGSSQPTDAYLGAIISQPGVRRIVIGRIW
jgi:hypothetical protein